MTRLGTTSVRSYYSNNIKPDYDLAKVYISGYRIAEGEVLIEESVEVKDLLFNFRQLRSTFLCRFLYEIRQKIYKLVLVPDTKASKRLS